MVDTPYIESPPIRVRRCRHGLFMYNINDKYIGYSLDAYGELSEQENVLYAQVVKPGMTVLDIGANIGVHTVSLARHVGPDGLVHAFEPQRTIYQMLCGNIALNSLYNVHTRLVGVGDRIAQIPVPFVDYTKPSNFGGVEIGRTPIGELVPLITVDSLNLQKCHFIKIDVEGMEQVVLDGALQTIRRCNPIIYMENDRPHKSETLIRYMLDRNYRLYWHTPYLYDSNNYFKNPHDAFPGILSVNMICIPPSYANINADGFKEITYENAHQFILS